MHLRTVIILLLLSSTFLGAQVDEDFNLNDISELAGWSGDLNDFQINDQQQLQLNAIDGGTSIIRTVFSSSGNVEWEFYFKMEFAPSNSNQLRMYLFVDTEDVTLGNGYFIEVGETGSEDNLEIYRQDDGQATLIGEGVMSTLGADPAEARVQINLDTDGFWSLSAAYGSEPFTQLEIEFVDDTYQVEEGFFAIQCDYTSTRVDKFFFDNIYAGDEREDIQPPQLVITEIIDDTHVRLVFDELVDESTINLLDIFNIDNGIGNPSSIEFGVFSNELILELNTALLEGIVYELTITNLEDLSGNSLTTTVQLILASIPEQGELVINEILFDPYVNGEDYVELYNNSDKYLDLSSLVISNTGNEQERTIEANRLLAPFEYIAITPDREGLSDFYTILVPENIIQNSLPAFNNSDGNVSISILGTNDLIDSYDYAEDDHSPWIDDTEGVSLERVNPTDPTDDTDNWQSASSASGFGTPGYQNSNFSDLPVSEDEFLLEKKTFSPDGDGFDDFLQINYRVSEPGFVLNMRVFDDRGHFVKTLANNEILSRSGSVIWNGENDEGTMAGLGIYIIFLEYFNTDGSLHQKKLSCVLAKQLN